MKGQIYCTSKIDGKEYELWIDIIMISQTDVRIKKGRYFSIFFCVDDAINTKSSSKDYQDAFEITRVDRLELIIEFKHQPEEYRVISLYNKKDHTLFIHLGGE
jgi:hypothetical protein